MLLRRQFQGHDARMLLQEQAEYCLKCSVCGLVCVVNYADIYGPRETFVYDLFNDGGESRETLWGCPSCHKCEERCPYEFQPLVLVKAHKEAAFAEGLAPKEVYGEFETIINTGSAFPLSRMTQRQRDKLGLPPLPDYPADELAIIAKHTGLADRLAAVREMQQEENENE